MGKRRISTLRTMRAIEGRIAAGIHEARQAGQLARYPRTADRREE
jgi:hypothetical protein